MAKQCKCFAQFCHDIFCIFFDIRRKISLPQLQFKAGPKAGSLTLTIIDLGLEFQRSTVGIKIHRKKFDVPISEYFRSRAHTTVVQVRQNMGQSVGMYIFSCQIGIKVVFKYHKELHEAAIQTKSYQELCEQNQHLKQVKSM